MVEKANNEQVEKLADEKNKFNLLKASVHDQYGEVQDLEKDVRDQQKSNKN